jgi:hypothetical protein
MEKERMIEGSMKYEILLWWQPQFDESVWKQRTFSAYTDDPGRAKASVFNAANRVAEDLGLFIPDPTGISLQNKVDLNVAPAAVFLHMSQAVTLSTALPPGERLARALRKQVEFVWPESSDAAWYWRAFRIREFDPAVTTNDARLLVLSAIDLVMEDAEKKLPPAVRTNLANSIERETRIQAALGHMKEAADQAVDA